MDEIVVPFHDLLRLIDGPKRWPPNDILHGVCLELERGDDAEVAATPPDRPEKVGILLCIHSDKRTICKNHVSF